MALFLNAQETVFRYGEYVEEFHDAFKSDEITFGSPDDFFALCKDLKTNIPLRTELAKLTKSLLDKENNKISVRTVLTIIAIASGGPETTAAGRDMSKPANILIGFLTNAAGCRQINPDDLDSMCISTPTPSDQNLPPIPTSDIPAKDPSGPPVELQNTPSDSDVNFDDNPPATPPPTNSEDFKQSFARLELNTLEVKLHLDSIDQRIARMEPHLENVPQLVTPSTDPFQHTNRPHALPTFTPHIAATAIAEPEPEPDELLLHGSGFRSVPFESYDDPSPFLLSGAGVILTCILFGLIIGASVFLYQHRADHYPYRTYQYIQQRVSALRQPHTTAPVAAAPASAPDTNTNSAPAANATNTTPAPQPEPTTPEPAPLPVATVEVTSSAMTANIISAPKPIYPTLARKNHIQGHVILQATVSPDGAVQDLHGIKGPRMLQDAAVDAVSSWRYKPYLVSGHPMPVAILVTIDFTLKPAPNDQQSSLTPSQ